MGLRKLSGSGCTQLFRNWVLLLGRKGRKQFKEAILSQLDDFPDDLVINLHIFYLLQTRVINFVQKDIGQMFPKWEFDVEDTPAENIIKLMFVKKPWKWTMDCWEVTAKKMVVKEDSPRPRKKARKEAPVEATTEASEEIKYPSERVEAVEKKVGITTKWKGTSSQNTTSPPKPTLEPGVSNESSPNKRLTRQIVFALFLVCQNMCALFIVYGFYICILVKVLMGRTREGRAWWRVKVQMCPQLCPQMLVPRKIKLQNRALRRMLDIRKRGMLLWQFAVQRVIEQGNLVIIPNKKLYPGYNPFAPIDKKKLKELADWLKTCPNYRTALYKKPLVYVEDLPRYDANPQHFRSERMCFLGRRLPGGAELHRHSLDSYVDIDP
ncbi:unnamed protein product [Brassica napus]|uniref:(rape) hypothetical protein n=1 Tax=Brassica napus TaxID=3708 RepID=A0A816QGI1_BRANA|nr:unnamed protein product [Brassica napus]